MSTPHCLHVWVNDTSIVWPLFAFSLLISTAIRNSARLCTTQPSSFTPPNEPQNNLWYWVDLPAMANEAGSLPFIADADKGQAPPGIIVSITLHCDSEFLTHFYTGSLPEPGQTVVQIPNNHVNYIITWYLLTAFLAAMVYRFGKKPVRVPRHPVNKSK